MDEILLRIAEFVARPDRRAFPTMTAIGAQSTLKRAKTRGGECAAPELCEGVDQKLSGIHDRADKAALAP